MKVISAQIVPSSMIIEWDRIKLGRIDNVFEFNIINGMPVHKTEWKLKDNGRTFIQNKRGNHIKIATGEIIWKLAFRCVTCGTLSEECFCYTSHEALIKDRDEHKSTWHCSLDCMVKDKTPEEQKAWVNGQRRRLYKLYHGHPPFVKWWDINAVIEYIMDTLDYGEPWFPEGSDLECPT